MEKQTRKRTAESIRNSNQRLVETLLKEYPNCFHQIEDNDGHPAIIAFNNGEHEHVEGYPTVFHHGEDVKLNALVISAHGATYIEGITTKMGNFDYDLDLVNIFKHAENNFDMEYLGENSLVDAPISVFTREFFGHRAFDSVELRHIDSAIELAQKIKWSEQFNINPDDVLVKISKELLSSDRPELQIRKPYQKDQQL